MSSDKAKITYNENQHYRSVVMQQGRVTLEADWNEQGQIVAEEVRKEALDCIGPSGTPDDGYAVTKVSGGAYDLSLSPGTFYVGGMRVSLDQTLNYGNQPEWLDYETDPDWVPVPSETPTAKEYVYLFLREQEISAVEDSALLEVALGGPDSAARTRLLQRIVRTPSTRGDCPSALAELTQGRWKQQGLAFDPATLRLESKATLALNFDTPATPSDPCQPQSTGGYLGAENQLIRVKISVVDTVKKEYKLVWGFDNASNLYRVKEVNSNQKLTLNTQPVDSVHRPKKSQAVEILRAAAQLANGEYIAADHGFVTQLAADYQSDQQSVELNVQLPVGYPQDQNSNLKPIFLRVWQEEISFMPGTPVKLGGTGLEATLVPDSNGIFHIGDFWVFAVRPGTPTEIYPQRYNNKSPQLPDGPRLWACSLALLDWHIAPPLDVLDCRDHFDNLVELTRRKLGGCCTVTVRPEDISATVSLQNIIDRYKNKNPIIICLMPGVYSLQKPLILGPEHSNLTLSGCHDDVILQAEKGSEDAFLDGLIVLNRANGVSFRRLRFKLPQASLGNFSAISAAVETKTIRGALNQVSQNLKVSIGIRVLHCALLNIEDCLFRFSLTKGENVWGAGIFANSECWGLHVKSCRFLHEEDYLETQATTGFWRILSGFILTPAFEQRAGEINARAITSIVSPLLQDAYFDDNLFSGLTFATFIYSDAGILEFRKNTVRGCMAGFFYASLLTLAYAGDFNIAGRLLTRDTDRIMTGPIQAIGQDPYFLLGSAIARSLPLPKIFNAHQALDISTQQPDSKDDSHFVMLQQSLNQMLNAIIVKSPVADSPNPTPVQEPKPLTSPDVISRVESLEQSFNHVLDAIIGKPSTNDNPTITPFQGGKIELAREEAIAHPSQQFIHPATLRTLAEVHQILLANERLALPLIRQKQPSIDLCLHFVDNDVDAQLGKLEFNFAFVALATSFSSEGSLIMSGNRLQNHSERIPPAMVWAIKLCTITGNLIQNQAAVKESRATSLFVLPSASENAKSGLAVTSNILLGIPIWPSSRGFLPAKNTFLDTWDFLNTII